MAHEAPVAYEPPAIESREDLTAALTSGSTKKAPN